MSDGEERKSAGETIRTTFTRGIVLIVPLVITVWVLNGLFNVIDGIISPLFDHLLERHVPGLGFISMVVLIFVIGWLSRNLIGNTIFKFFERIIASIPLARTIYSSMKDVVNALQLGGKGRSFRQVVLMEYPRPGLYTIGFVTNEINISTASGMREVFSVYVPNPPNPTSGFMVLIPKAEARVLDMTVEQGLKMVLSGGIVSSSAILAKALEAGTGMENGSLPRQK